MTIEQTVIVFMILIVMVVSGLYIKVLPPPFPYGELAYGQEVSVDNKKNAQIRNN